MDVFGAQVKKSLSNTKTVGADLLLTFLFESALKNIYLEYYCFCLYSV